jgi:hypothetical protein
LSSRLTESLGVQPGLLYIAATQWPDFVFALQSGSQLPGLEFRILTDQIKIAVRMNERYRKFDCIEGNEAVIAFPNKKISKDHS